ncbi:MAG: radical SAM protein [Candidatus Omnitrophota bacterium]
MVELDKVILKGIENGRQAFKGPKIVQIDLTGNCNNDCIGCWVHSPYIKNPPRDKNVVLPFNKVRDLIEVLSLLQTQEIFLSGAGDPFMHPNILDIIELIKSKGFKLNIITNFTLLDEVKANRIVDLGVDLITASVWAGTESGYIKTHPSKTKDDFIKLGNNLRGLARIKEEKNKLFPFIKIYNVICNQNYNEICEMVDFALSVKAGSVEFQVMDLVENATSFLALSNSNIRDIKSQFDLLGKHKGLYYQQELLKYNLTCNESPELKEFSGRFLMLPSGFSILKGSSITQNQDSKIKLPESIVCPKGVVSGSAYNNFICDEENNIFYFPFVLDNCAEHKCQDCQFNEKRQLPVKFLKIFGYGSFMRRLDSVNLYDNNYENEFINKIPCYVGWTYSRILSTGEVIPCCKSVNKPLGNINKHSFVGIWNSSAYRKFRNKAKLFSKNNPYFKRIDCCKSCDNVGINLQIHQQVIKYEENLGKNKSNISLAQRLRLILKLKAPKVEKPIIVAAAKFNRGNLNSHNHGFGKGVIIDGGNGFGWSEYDIIFKESGQYQLWSIYASGQARPVELYFDGQLIVNDALSSITGGWGKRNKKWFREKCLDINAGKHTLKIFTKKLIPHIQGFAFYRDSNGANRKEMVCRKEEIFPKSSPLRLLKDEIEESGLMRTASRLFNHIRSGRFLHNYLDVLGVYQGQYAFCGPTHVQIDLTYNCNNNCIGCWCNSPLLDEKTISPEVKAETLPFGLLIELLDHLAKMGTKEIYFSGGGEPFIHPQIMEILEYAKKKKFVCYVNTNFTLLDKEKIKKLIALGVDHLTVSTWAANAKTYVITHPNKNEETFKQIVENLKYLNKTKLSTPYIKLYNVIFNLNYQEIKDMVRLAEETGSESVEFTLIDTIPGKTDKLLLNQPQIEQLQKDSRQLASCLDKNGRLGSVLLFRFDSFLRRISSSTDLQEATYDRNIIDKIPCYIGWSFARIMPNGDVNACLKAHRIPTGNLYRTSFNQIWNGEKQQYFRKKTLVQKKSDQFFQSIGNNPQIKEAGCYKSCDDIGRNIHMHNRIMSLTLLERLFLKALAKIKKKPRLGYSSRAKSPDPLIAGIHNGREAFIGPEQVVIDLTNRCNLKCAGCWLYSPLLKQKPAKELLAQELGYQNVKQLIARLAELGTKRIRFTGGGEPFMHPNIMELLAYAKSKGLICCITTNLLLLDKEKIKRLIQLGVDELAVSLWACKQDTYQKTHWGCSPRDFEKIKENLMILFKERKNKPLVTLSNVICNLNYLEVEEMFKFALEMNADGIYYTLLDTLDGTGSLLLNKEQREIVFRQAEAIKTFWTALDQKPKIRLEFFDGFVLRLKEESSSVGNYDYEMISKMPCYAGWSFTRVLADGGIAPCCRGVNKLMGNINTQDFKDIWFSQQYCEFRSKARYLPKNDPYFTEIGCLKMCDNLMHNKEIHRRLTA